MKVLISLLVIVASFDTHAYTAAASCRVIDNKNDNANVEACLRSPLVKWTNEIPELTVDDILNGPSNHLSLKPTDEVYCAFRPHPASQTSPKFRCFRTTPRGFRENGVPEFYNLKGEIIPLAKSVGAEGSPFDGMLLDDRNQPIRNAEGTSFEEGDELKIKYFEGGSQQGSHFEGAQKITNPRQSEGFTETAVSRIFWVLGIPVDKVYNVAKVHCFGCTADPFHQLKAVPGSTATFHDASVELKYPGKKISEIWSWQFVVSQTYPTWPNETRIDFEQLILASHLVAYHSDKDFQNRLSCTKGAIDKLTSVCSQPIALINDVGSTFGRRRVGKEKENPRGSLDGYRSKLDGAKGRVFFNSQCLLRYQLGGIETVSLDGLNEFRRRIQTLNREKIRAIFVASKFGRMEPRILQQMGSEGAIIDAWTDEFEARVNEIKFADCP
jgi:hypothetical protein